MQSCGWSAARRVANRRASLVTITFALTGCAAGTGALPGSYESFTQAAHGDGMRAAQHKPAAPMQQAAPDSLHGVWRGTYAGRRYARRGHLTLHLVPATDSAVGSMTFDGIPPPRGTWGDDDQRSAAPGSTRVPVTAVVVVGTHVTLRLLPYFDRGCGCTLTLAYTGQLRGDTLAGRFTADGSPTVVPERGARWRIVREGPVP